MAVRGVINEFFNLEDFQKQLTAVTDGINKYIDLVKATPAIRASMADPSNVKQTVEGMKALGEQNKKVSDTTTIVVNSQRELDKAMLEARIQKQEYNKELKAEILLQNSATGSVNEAKAAIVLLTAQRNNLNIKTAEGAKAADLINKKIDEQNEVIKQNVSLLERQKINIGNYQGSAKIIVDALERARSKVESVGKAFGQASPEAQAARKEFESLDRITQNPQFLNIASKVGDLNKELRFGTQELARMEQAGMRDSEVYRELRTRLAQLTDQMADTRAEIKALSSDTRTFDLFAGAVSFAADTFQAAAGAAVLFGASEEDAAKATKTLIAVQSVSNGVKGIANELTTDGTAANKVYAFTQGLVAKATDTSASAFTRLKASLGILALIATVVGGIVLAYNLLSKSTQEVLSRQRMLNDLTKEAAENYGKEKAELDTLVGVINKEGATRKEKLNALKDLQEKYPGYFDNLKTEKDLNNDLAIAYANAAAGILGKARAQAAADKLAINEAEKLKLEIDFANESEKFQKESISRAAGLRKQDREQFFKDIPKEAALRRTTFEQKKAEIEKENKFLLELAVDQKQKEESVKKPDKDKKDNKAKEAADKELQIQFNILKLGLQQIADFNKEIVDDESKTFEERLIALQKYMVARNQIVDAQAELEKQLGKKTASELLLVDRQRADEKLRISREVVDLSAAIQKNGVSAGIKVSKEEKENIDKLGQQVLDGFKTRSEKELAIVKDLLDKKKVLRDEEKELQKNLYSELEGFSVEFFTSQQDREIARNEDESARIDERKQKEIEAINQTVTDKTVAADQIRIVEAKAAADKAVLDNKNRELERKKQSIERLGKIAEIAGNTAQGVASLSVRAAEARAQAALLASNPLTAAFAPIALANSAIILGQIPLVIGIGAAQIARLAIPKFKDGGITPGGPVVVGDGGKSEGVKLPDGTILKTPDRSTVVDLPKGSQVFPDFKEMLLNSSVKEIPDVRVVVPFDKTERAIQKMEKSIVRTIKNKQENHWHMPGRYDMAMRDGSRFRAYLKDNL
jgi:hypothetical protein